MTTNFDRDASAHVATGTDKQTTVLDGWRAVPCPNCESTTKTEIFHGRNKRYGIDVSATVVECDACGMWRTDPQPTDATAAALYPAGEYYTHSAPKTGRAAHVHQWLRTQMAAGPISILRSTVERATDLPRFSLRFAGDHFPLHRGLRLLDVGCGDGSLIELLSRVGIDGIGLEPDPAARKAAAQRGVTAIESLDQCAGLFDRAVLRHVLEHVDDPVETLRSVASRVDHDGLIMISVPNARSLQAEVFGPYWEGWDLPRHRWHFTASSLTQLCVKAGLRTVHLRTVELHAFAAASREHLKLHDLDDIDYTSRGCSRIERSMQGTELVAVLEHLR